VEKQSDRLISQTGPIVNQPRHLRRVIRVIAESGAAYTIMVFIAFIIDTAGSNALYIASDIVRDNQACPYFAVDITFEGVSYDRNRL
jgi:hypothetical protein